MAEDTHPGAGSYCGNSMTVNVEGLPGGTLRDCKICGGRAVMKSNSGCNVSDLFIVCTGESCPAPDGPFANYCGWSDQVSHKSKRDLIIEWNNQNSGREPSPKSTLDTCPFCGGQAAHEKDMFQRHYVRCFRKCGVFVEGSSESDARERWNRRAGDVSRET